MGVYYEYKRRFFMSARTQEQSDTTVVALKVARGLTYLVYAYVLVAITFLAIGSVLLLFGANKDVGFTQFVYTAGSHFLEPFRGIFPGVQVGDSGYFSTSAVFAIIMYTIFALALHALINYVTLKMVQHEEELKELER